MAGPTKRAQEPASVLAQTRGREDAFEVIFAPSARQEGGRHFALGAPGYGKTWHLREVVSEAVARGLVDVVLVHDVKGREAEFEGTPIVNAEAIAGAPPSRVYVFRGSPRHDIACEADEPARLALRFARDDDPLRVALVLNELDEALTDGGRSWRAPAVRTSITQGRALEVWVMATTQQPHRCPNEPFDQATSIAFFHLDARACNYLSGTLLLDPAMVRVLPTLQVGQFVLWRPGCDWDGCIYA